MTGRPKQKAVILIVEDEPLLRMAATSFVEEAGFEAIEAENAVVVMLEETVSMILKR